MLSSSIQATLAGRFGTSEYGLSKKAGEDLFFQYGEETGARVLVYRFPNLVSVLAISYILKVLYKITTDESCSPHSGTLPEESSFFTSIGHPIPAVCTKVPALSISQSISAFLPRTGLLSETSTTILRCWKPPESDAPWKTARPEWKNMHR